MAKRGAFSMAGKPRRYSWDGYRRLAAALAQGAGRWMVSYDDDERVADLYPNATRARFRIGHTARAHRQGEELAIFGDRVQVSELAGLGTGGQFLQPPMRP